MGGPTEESGTATLFDLVQTLVSGLAQLGGRIANWLESNSEGAPARISKDFRANFESMDVDVTLLKRVLLNQPYALKE